MFTYQSTLSKTQLDELILICGASHVLFKEEEKELYGSDETEDYFFVPAVVVKPASSNEISKIMKLANRDGVPVTPRGAGTGLSGGALPVFGGIVLSTERLNRIIEIDERNLQATVEPGVINQVFRDAVEIKDCFIRPILRVEEVVFWEGIWLKMPAVLKQ